MNKTHLTWTDTGSYINNMIEAAMQSNIKFTKVLSVARGGNVPAAVVAHRLNIPLDHLFYSSKVGNGDGKNHPNVIPDFNENEVILVIDDLTDSGHTMNELKQKMPNSTMFATVLHKTSSVYKPDFIGHILNEVQMDSWIYFPWQ